MQEPRNRFKNPFKKFEPKGLTILYEDRDILVVDKVSGLLTISDGKASACTAHELLNHYVRRGNPKSRNRIYIVHRLDRETSGVLVFAKTEAAKQTLQEEWHNFQKTYYAVVEGTLPEKEGVITSYLAENRAFKMYSVSDPKKGKLAKTGYRVLKESPSRSLLEIELLTGRKNQIRVHLADKGCPVAGDAKYGDKKKNFKKLTLHSASLTLTHPFSKKEMTFISWVPAYFELLIQGAQKLCNAELK
ncbi:MAG: rRNA synthase [Verrucomicrobiota bacterium]|jgi:tRNA pseudouridine32 synthase/23S rRNA pseudouridine746 synthase/23S rRNA pseudouridine1911/1915/1917 synthase|nr:rRNA synthase [Verrucomicrobiota bacterium]